MYAQLIFSDKDCTVYVCDKINIIIKLKYVIKQIKKGK